MTPDRDIERLLDVWLAEGPTQVSDRAFDDAVDRLHRQGQRPAWRFPRRDFQMSTNLRLAAAAVAILAVAAVGAQFLPGSGPGTTTPTALPTATPTPTVTLAPTPFVDRYCPEMLAECTTPLAAGRYTTTAFAAPYGYDLPNGWAVPLDVEGASNLMKVEPPSDLIGVFIDWQVANQATCSSQPEDGVGRTAADLMSWLDSNLQLDATAPVPAAVGGLTGQMVEFEALPGATFQCPLELSLFTHDGTVNDGGWWTIDRDERSRMYILDAGGERTVTIDIRAPKTTFDTYVVEAQAIVDSFDFTP